MKNAIRDLLLQPLIGLALLLAANAALAAKDTKEDPGASPPQDGNSQGLPKRVKQLETDVGELQALNLPMDVTVNCGTGDSVNRVLTTHANGLGRLTIRISGACIETVVVTRSNVAIFGNGSDALIQAPTPQTFGMLIANGARAVTVADLKLSGGQGLVAVSKNAHAVFTNIIGEGSNIGMVAADNGTLDLTSATLRNNNFGAFASRRGAILISNSTVENNGTGLLAFKGGLINATSLLPDGTTGTGVIVRNNGTGGIARSGGVLELSDTRVEANRGLGLLVDTSSALQFFNTLNGTGNQVINNLAAGVQIQRTASVVFTDTTNVITGNNFGVFCQAGSATAPPPLPQFIGNVSGNTSGNIVGCVP